MLCFFWRDYLYVIIVTMSRYYQMVTEDLWTVAVSTTPAQEWSAKRTQGSV